MPGGGAPPPAAREPAAAAASWPSAWRGRARAADTRAHPPAPPRTRGRTGRPRTGRPAAGAPRPATGCAVGPPIESSAPDQWDGSVSVQELPLGWSARLGATTCADAAPCTRDCDRPDGAAARPAGVGRRQHAKEWGALPEPRRRRRLPAPRQGAMGVGDPSHPPRRGGGGARGPASLIRPRPPTPPPVAPPPPTRAAPRRGRRFDAKAFNASAFALSPPPLAGGGACAPTEAPLTAAGTR